MRVARVAAETLAHAAIQPNHVPREQYRHAERHRSEQAARHAFIVHRPTMIA